MYENEFYQRRYGEEAPRPINTRIDILLTSLLVLAFLAVAFSVVILSGLGPKTPVAMGSVGDSKPVPVIVRVEVPGAALPGEVIVEPSPPTTAPEKTGGSASEGLQATQPAQPEAQSPGGSDGSGALLSADAGQNSGSVQSPAQNDDNPGRHLGQQRDKKNK